MGGSPVSTGAALLSDVACREDTFEGGEGATNTAIRRGSRAAWVTTAVGGVLVVAGAATGSGGWTAVASTLSLLIGIGALLVRRPPQATAWWLLLLSVAMVVIARISSFALHESAIVGRFAASDIRAVIFYVALVTGLALIGGRTSGRALADTLDAAIVAAGVFLMMWLFVLGGMFTLTSSTIVTAYLRPFGVAALAGVLTRLFFVVAQRTPMLWLLAAATGCAMAGAVVTIGRAVGYPFLVRMEDSGIWFAAFTVLVAAAILHPSSMSPPPTRERDLSRLSRARLTVFIAMTLLGPFSWLVAVLPSPFQPRSLREFGLPVGVTALISLLLLWRLSLITQLADSRADQLETLRNELAFRATHDPLTGLGNRAELMTQLDAVVGGRGRGERSALLLLDLDGFKQVNDSFGHPVGDELLVEVGRRLSELAGPDSTVVRLGGDEFAILLSDVDENTSVARAEAIRDSLRDPIPTSRGRLSISASVGVCVTPRVEMSASEVLRDADLALYAAKASGKNRIRTFDPGTGAIGANQSSDPRDRSSRRARQTR